MDPAHLGRLGWLERQPPNGRGTNPTSLQSSVEIVTTPTWKVARLWSTAATLQAVPLRPSTQRVILSVDGEATIVVDGHRRTLHPKQLVIFDGSSNLITKNEEIWARFELHLSSPLLNLRQFRYSQTLPLDISPDFYKLLSATVNIVSVSDAIGDDIAAGLLLNVFSGIIAAAVASAIDEPVSLTPAQRSLVDASERLMNEHLTDPQFDVASISAQLSVSRTLLHRAFAAKKTTPRRVLEGKRVTLAISLLELTPARGLDTLQRVAREAGFSSTRHMHNAFVRAMKSLPDLDVDERM